MSELHLTVEGYVREVGDLGLGKKGPAGRGIKIEMADGTDDVVITGLTINQCRAAAQDIGKKIIVDFRTQPAGAVNPTHQHQEFCAALRGMPCICNATPLETSAQRARVPTTNHANLNEACQEILRVLATEKETACESPQFICPLCNRPGLYSAVRTDGVCTDCANNGRQFPETKGEQT